jgi:hypothetical protein
MFVTGRDPIDPAVVCARVGHPEGWADDTHCSVCGAAVQWVRVEVTEGRAYTYMAFEEPPLERGEAVRLPGNSVQRSSFSGTVLRQTEPPTDYRGPFKAVIARVEPRTPCTCDGGYDDDCPMHGGLL